MGLDIRLEKMNGTGPSLDTPLGSSEQDQQLLQSGIESMDIGMNSIQIPVDEATQKLLVEIVLDDWNKAKGDRQKIDYGTTSKGETLRFDNWLKQIKDLYNAKRIPKTTPWRFCSNRSVRIATSILDMIHCRLFPAVWNEDLARWRPGKAVDSPKARRIELFMNWWIRVWSPMYNFFDKWTKYVTGIGDGLTESSWEVDEIGQEKICRRLIPKESVYTLHGARDIQKDPVMINEKLLYRQLEAMEKLGGAVNVTDKLAKLIYIPSVVTGNDNDEFRQVKLRNEEVEVVRWYGHFDYNGDGVEENIRVMVSPEHRLFLGGVDMINVTFSGRRPINFEKYDNYLDRMDDLDGEGVINKVKELAEEIDAIFNQMTDAHTLAVLRPFFYDPSGDVDAPAIVMGPNKGIPITDPQKNIYYPPFEIPTERLINAIRLVLEFVERLTAASEYIMGRESGVVGGSGTATRTNAIMQSAEIRFALPAERLRQGAANILTTELDLIQLNIPEGFEQLVLGEDGEPIFKAGELSDEGLSGKFTAYLLPDPSMGSKQTERDLMSMTYSILMQNIIVATDPSKIYQVTYDYLKAHGMEDQAKRYLGPPPSMDDIDSPEDENSLMVQGDFARVKANIAENHIEHIMKHQELLKSPSLALIGQTAPALAEQIITYNTQHIQEHMGLMQQMMGLMSKANKNGLPQGGAQDGSSADPVGGAKEGNEANAGVGVMENSSGPLGQALNQKRKGESGKSPSA